ncbi:MAG: mitofilin family membrane protein [Pseudomonadota bacterium]
MANRKSIPRIGEDALAELARQFPAATAAAPGPRPPAPARAETARRRGAGLAVFATCLASLAVLIAAFAVALPSLAPWLKERYAGSRIVDLLIAPRADMGEVEALDRRLAALSEALLAPAGSPAVGRGEISFLPARPGDGTRVEALEGRLAALDDRLAALSLELGKAQADIGGVRGRVGTVESGGGALTARLEAIEQGAGERAARIGDLEAWVRAARGRFDAADGGAAELAGRVATAERGGKDLSGRLETLAGALAVTDGRINAVQRGTDEVSARIDAVGGAVVAVVGRVEASERSVGDLRNVARAADRLLLVTLQLRAALATSRPYVREAAAVRAVAGEDGELLPVLAALSAYAPSGVATVAELRDGFALIAARVPRPDTGDNRTWTDRLGAWIASLLASPSAFGVARNGRVAAAVMLAEGSLAQGQLGRAIEEISKLDEQEAAFLADWLAQAKARLAVNQAVAVLSTRALDKVVEAN